ncbi:MAG: response regulator [bacterium]|jgi:two-component system chemotaxis response regulator CheY|nr:response regulator [bacterium]
MSTINILCIDDQRDVLATLRKDLTVFESHFNLIDCESAAEARDAIEEIDQEGSYLALLICDHLMPKKNGIDFLIEMHEDSRFSKTKKLLLTGMATHKDTIEAINMADIDRYIEKPWDEEELVHIVKELLTQFILSIGIEYQPYLNLLDQPTLLKILKDRT